MNDDTTTTTTTAAAAAADAAPSAATTTLVPTRDLVWGAQTLPKDQPFGFPGDVVQPLIDAGDARRPPASETASGAPAASTTPAAPTAKSK